jgi:8-oxo-dGTP diphosphatase
VSAFGIDGQLLAAGALCWRPGPDGELELLMVHSARWGDWSWPKGKLHGHESLVEAAVREVGEETGSLIELGVPLPAVSYVLPDGQPKTVHYWAGRIRDSGFRTAGADEIDGVEWLPARAARERLTRPGDRPPLDELLALAEQGRLDTRPLLVLRHAKAKGRSNWPGEEADRPLTRVGLRQAEALAGLLACWSPERTLSSPWERCLQTMQPYLDHRTGGKPLEVLPLLSEQGLRNNPARIGRTVEALLTQERSALICTHRPVLAAVMPALVESTALAVRDRLPAGNPWLSPAEVLVVQISRHQHGSSAIHRIHSVERHRAVPGHSPVKPDPGKS